MRVSKRLIAAVVLAVLAATVATLLLAPHQANVKRALVADSLSIDYPNPELVSYIVNVLREHGYQVDLVTGTNVTMDLYARLTNYDLVILRVHGGKAEYIGPDGRVHKINGLFTGMPWNPTYKVFKREWIATRAHPFNSTKTYLAVLPRFFDTVMKGRFRPGSVVIVASCYSLYTRDIADALARKGVSIFIGWPGPVTLHHMDEALRLLIEKAVVEGLPWPKAVEEVNRILGPDPLYNTSLRAIVYR